MKIVRNEEKCEKIKLREIFEEIKLQSLTCESPSDELTAHQVGLMTHLNKISGQTRKCRSRKEVAMLTRPKRRLSQSVASFFQFSLFSGV